MIPRLAGPRSLIAGAGTYRVTDLVGDVVGGVTTAVVALPIALALGVAVGLAGGEDAGSGALAGLYGAIAVGFFAAVFGGTRGQISGPTAPMAVAMTVVVLQFSLAEAFLVVVLAGIIQIVLGVLRVGRFISYTPYSVISGFMTGIGVIIMALQVLPFVGAPIESGSLARLIGAWPGAFGEINVPALAIAIVTLLVTIIWPRRFRSYCPPTLAALLVGTLLGLLWLSGAPTIGEVPSGLPSVDWPDASSDSWPLLIQAAFVLALIGSIDALLTSLVADSITRDTHRPNRELIGQGMGNTVSGLIGGLPGAGTTLTTVVNIRGGGRTAVSGVIVAGLFLALVLGAGSVTEPIPQAVLAGLLMKMGWEIIDWRFVRHIFEIERGHVVVMLLTLLLTLFVDLMVAVGIGLIVAGMANAVRSERLELDRVISVPLLEGDPDDPYLARIGAVALRGRFTVASATALVRVVGADIEEHEVVIFDFSETASLDDSAVMVIEQLFETAAENETPCVIAGLSDPVESALRSLGALDAIPAEQIVGSMTEARALARTLLDQVSDAS